MPAIQEPIAKPSANGHLPAEAINDRPLPPDDPNNVYMDDLIRGFRSIDRRTQVAIADWLLHKETEEDVDVPEDLRRMLEGLSRGCQLQIADWIVTKWDDDLGSCNSLDDYSDGPAIREACSPQVTIPGSGSSPLQQRIDKYAQASGPEEEPWPNLTNRQKAFLLNYVQRGSILAAAEGICHPVNPMVWNRTSPEFALAFEDVKALRQDDFLYRAQLSALFGDRVPYFHKGYPVLSQHERKQIYVTRRDGALLRCFIKLFARPSEARPPHPPKLDPAMMSRLAAVAT